ncbi:hypothetical protein EYF80_053458 [Liparis tanakae]|uniref:Uncharacterized protein n=1 Tax=Liparis tanakae TaxID=230148 RepID=A0A4Z2F6J7_9TELE|nr:hypothetical protein EYF80_053458 [Liparis tanakae]
MNVFSLDQNSGLWDGLQPEAMGFIRLQMAVAVLLTYRRGLESRAVESRTTVENQYGHRKNEQSVQAGPVDRSVEDGHRPEDAGEEEDDHGPSHGQQSRTVRDKDTETKTQRHRDRDKDTET